MEAHFILLQAKGNPKKFSIKRGQTLVIGRSSSEANIIVDDELCSSKHCKLIFELNKLCIEDMDSKNGTFLNGKKIKKQEIELNDKFEFGKMTLYLNTKLMKTAIKSVDSAYKGYVEENTEIAIDNSRVAAGHRHYDENTRTMMSRKNIEKGRMRYSPRPRSKIEMAVRTLVAQIVDTSMAFLTFFIIAIFATKTNPELVELSQKFHFIALLFQEEMYVYTGGALVVSFMFYNMNKKLPRGSIGERILKIRQ